MTVQLKVGMTAIRRDGERVGPVTPSGNRKRPFLCGGWYMHKDGTVYAGIGSAQDIIAAGYPWGDLGAQVGDTVRCAWCSDCDEPHDSWEPFVVDKYDGPNDHPDSLYVIVKRAAKPAVDDKYEAAYQCALRLADSIMGKEYPENRDWRPLGDLLGLLTQIDNMVAGMVCPKPCLPPADRPRAAHKLDLRDGDVVELVKWQNGNDADLGERFKFDGHQLRNNGGVHNVPCPFHKGQRPLFRVISRAAEQKPDEVIVRYGDYQPDLALYRNWSPATSHRFTLTFPAGSDTGTVVREAL